MKAQEAHATQKPVVASSDVVLAKITFPVVTTTGNGIEWEWESATRSRWREDGGEFGDWYDGGEDIYSCLARNSQRHQIVNNQNEELISTSTCVDCGKTGIWGGAINGTRLTECSRCGRQTLHAFTQNLAVRFRQHERNHRMKISRILLAVICTALFSFGCSGSVVETISERDPSVSDELWNKCGESNFDSGVTYGVIAAVRFLEEGRYDATLAEINERARKLRDEKL